ncbi:pseudouridine synthase [Hymenobacter caeli]|uniref:Pseudouridine synthase n=1 Tax=Hymenobacter caeli TaxID=2735894 RepID=A0ABX2FP54_9BACT|nr:pseudouridine synthase [Hymenobacter caeli]NRT18925.1 23S rRNA pseudouridine2605 synthase [Hymenobacter caeli]
MGKQHFSKDKGDRRGGAPGSFGRPNSSDRPSGGRRGATGDRPDNERRSFSGDRPGGERRPSYGDRPGGERRSAPERGGFGGNRGAERSGPSRDAGGSGYSAGRSSFGGGNRLGGDAERRPYNQGGGSSFGGRREERSSAAKEQRTGTSYGRTDRGAERPARENFDRRSGGADERPARPYQPRENWSGQPYRQEGRPAVPRGVPGERNRKFQKQNPYAADENTGSTGSGSAGFGRSTPREESPSRPDERGPNRPIRSARPFAATPPQPREVRGDDRNPNNDRGGDRERSFGGARGGEGAFERKFTPGAFGRRDGAPSAPRSNGERPGGFEKRSFGGERDATRVGSARPDGDERPALGKFAQRREELKAQERSVRRSGTGYGTAGAGQANRADKPRFGERPGEAPDYKNLKHYEADKDRGNKRRRDQENQDFATDELRLNRYIANAGICSRREADALIAAGEIRVNGEVVTEMGYKVQPEDTVQYGKTNLNREKSVYVLLNKPKDFITTTDDPEGRRTVMELVANSSKERIFPVGRLDRNTTGLLLFTNDGEVAQRLSHPSHKNKKIYQVELSTPLTEDDLRKISAGIELEDGKAEVDDVAVVAGNPHFVGIEIHIGRNRIVRRIFEHLGYEIVALDRVQYAGLTKKDLPRGKWRFLSEQEVIRLKYFM